MLNIDRTSFKSLLAISIMGVLIIVVSIVGFINITGRFSRLYQAEEYMNDAGKLDSDYQASMAKYFELKKLKKGLKVDSTSSSYNSRIKTIIDKIKVYNLDMLSVEYGKDMSSKEVKYLPVTFELSGDFNKVLVFIEYVENEIQVMGFSKLEISTTGASETNLNVNCIINFYELVS